MNPQLTTIIALILGLGAGMALGWLAASRGLAEWRRRLEASEAAGREQGERFRELEERFRAAIRDLAGASERGARADALAGELAGARDALGTARAELATLHANAAHLEEQKRLLLTSQETLRKEFEAAGNRVLASAQESFLARAQARFEESEKTNEARIKAVLQPVGERLTRYEEQVRALEARRVDAFGQLFGQIEAMRAGQEQVRVAADKLGNSLRNAPKARGRWGEQQLRNVLEQCGLAEHTDFVTEHSINTEDGRLRPDAIVNIPGHKKLVIDAKVSLNAYQDAFEAEDEVVRARCLDAHAASMRAHIQTLASKSYQHQFEDAPDYVLMFVPGEHFIAAALDHDSQLWDFAFERRVLLASPTNLVAIARTVAMVWTQDKLAREAAEIGRMGGELYDRIAVAAEHLKRVGGGLESAVSNYNKFVSSFDRNVRSSAKRLRDKGIEIGKREIDEVPVIETQPRHYDAPTDDVVYLEPLAPLLPELNPSSVASTS